ncbi:hypothetical protein JKF63_02291 [Porcisia hertigi]|uniref:Enoyl-CoA hydratase n=1 Tax=Porcisia hertigi TaxID=2761500 RepID=A0A836IDG6_9TRYP|nr:hypothetical protein JKF63_02291 [Porcisia hertigi]
MHRLETLSKHLQDNIYVRIERRGAVGLIRMLGSAPPRSQVGGCVLCAPMRGQILRALKALEADTGCVIIVLTSTSHRFFSSGIDISNFKECLVSDPTAHPPVPSLSELTAAVARCPKVCIAAIRGLCSSWGLELALAADYRICEVNARFRFPEVLFGITPSGGGAQRLVCQVGVPQALNMLCYGRPLHAKEAYQIGLIEAPACGALRMWTALTDFIQRHVMAGTTLTRGAEEEEARAAKALALSRRRTSPAYAAIPFFKRGWCAWLEHKLRESVPREVQAPYRAIEAVKLAVTHSCRDGGLTDPPSSSGACGTDPATAYAAAEKALFESCLLLSEAQASQHLLRAAQRTSMTWEMRSMGQQRPSQGQFITDNSSTAGPHAAQPTDAPAPVHAPRTDDATMPLGLKTVAVIGSGTMGSSIALMLLWQADIEVILVVMNPVRLQTARQTIEKYLRGCVEAHRLSVHRCDDMLRRLHVTGSCIGSAPSPLVDVDLVFECAPEVPGVKENIFAQLDSVCKPSTILATSSSAQDVNKLAAVTRRPGQVLGMHFFPPANESPLVEVIRGTATEVWVVERIMHLLCLLDKYPIVSISRHGYVGTRLLLAALYQAYAMLEDGCFPLQIDSALRKSFHFTRGIFELEDIMGLDVIAMARASMSAAAAQDHASSTPPPKRVSIGPSEPGAVELSNAWWLPSRAVYDIPNGLIAAGAIGRKAGEGWYTYVTTEEATLKHRLRHPIASWVWTKSSPRHVGAKNDVSGESGAGAASGEDGTPTSSNATTGLAATASRRRYPLLSLQSLIMQHSYSVEYRTIDCSRHRRITRRPFRDEEIFERIVLAMVNEAAKIMADGIITDAADIDCISVYGFGFPAWKGGLCYYADNVAGIDKIVQRMQVYHRALGSDEFPAPCEALKKMQTKGLTFSTVSRSVFSKSAGV